MEERKLSAGQARLGESVPAVFGQFHMRRGKNVVLSEGMRVASVEGSSFLVGSVQIAFSNNPIPTGLQFSVKVLQEGELCGLVIGVTTEDPETTSLPQGWDDIMRDQYWYITSLKDKCRARHKAQERELQWVLDRSAGNTIGCCVLETGELHLYHNGRDVGVAWKGLPTDQPLWGFVEIRGWKIKANYIIPKSHPQDYAGKTFQFVERPPEWLICVVCQSLAHNPVQANCCGKIYCTRCIERWKTRSNSCPSCRSTQQSNPPFATFQDRNAHQNVLVLSVYCPNGCGKKMELTDVENHLTSDNGCPDQVVECGNKCGHKDSRATVKKHMTNKCRLRQEKCRYCSLVSTHEQVTGDHLKQCPNYPLECPNECGAGGLTRSTVPAHLELCPMQFVDCEYKGVGCGIVLPRKYMAVHLQASVEEHLQMTKRRVKEQEVHLQEQEVCLQEQAVRLQEQEVRLQEQEERLQKQEVHLQNEKAERQRIQSQAEKEWQRMNDVIANLVARVGWLELMK